MITLVPLCTMTLMLGKADSGVVGESCLVHEGGKTEVTVSEFGQLEGEAEEYGEQAAENKLGMDQRARTSRGTRPRSELC